MTRIAILETGAPPPAMAALHGDYPAMFRTLLGEGHDIEVFRSQSGEWPDPVAFETAIITGSAAGVYEDHPWIADLLGWIRGAKGRTGLVGVCFGHQAMAQALGGKVEKSDRGWGVGLHRYEVASAEPWMTPAAATVAIPASHQDQVVEPPADSRVILRSDFTPFAGLAWGRRRRAPRADWRGGHGRGAGQSARTGRPGSRRRLAATVHRVPFSVIGPRARGA